MNKIITFYPSHDFKLSSSSFKNYYRWLQCTCGHKGPKSIEYIYYTTLTEESDLEMGNKNIKYTFKVCRKCFEKNHEQWMTGNNLPKKYLDKEVLYFRSDLKVKSNR